VSRTVLVTGAGRGVGAAIARDAAGRGHRTIVNYRRDRAAADRVVAGIRAAGGHATAMRADVTDPAQVDELVTAATAEFGHIDAVVVNANAAPPPFAGLADLSWEAFADKVLGELAGAFHVTRRVLPQMRARRDGRLVYIGSTAADYVGGGRLAHGTAKSALATFARHVAAETARDGIGVLTVAPGAVRTDATAAVLDERREAALADNSVLGRMLDPDDVAAVVGTALDPALRIATGATIRADAGWSVLVGGPTG
jgi:3-oxoacyl-[acyl-carrier protein] reductase